MIAVRLAFQIEEQRRKAIHAQRGCGEDRAFKAVGSMFAQGDSGRPGSISEMIGHAVQKLLDAVRIFQAAQCAQLFTGKPKGGHRGKIPYKAWWPGVTLR